jgi:undecaprenyl-diphosphatase
MLTDPQLGLFIHELTPPTVLWIFSLFLICMLLYRKKRDEAAVFFIALLSTTAAVFITKVLFAVPRPEDALITLTSYAFPSGHAASGAFLCVMLSWLYIKSKRLSPLRVSVLFIFLCMGLFLGYSRLLIGVHTPLQVAAGFIIGTAIPLLVIKMYYKNYFPFLGK